ncbi:MAG TPA: trypsin-like peptidase domain-containing protein [Longimicrobiaceae bacterium]|nr:trypsin-like peptidase domain-containing protein [Longimicrobiaceae bacterium]
MRRRLGGAPATLDTATANALSSTFRAAAERALPAVVFIGVEQEIVAGQATPVPEPFRRFFGLPPEGFELPPRQGSGSGFIFDETGHVLTNHHVVADATRVLVRLLDGREYDAEVIGGDASTDVAVLRISAGEGEGLPAAALGDSDEVRVGDWVLALGNPLGLDFTVTAGIVSAKGRQLTGRATALESFIQTDAAINPGNSGGPLIDLLGRVVGINSAISGGPRFIGYGFAVPVNLAHRVAADLIRYGYVRRPRIGVGVNDVTAVDAEAYGLPEVAGAEVVSVEERSPAAAAGLRVGDVILELDGRPLPDAAALTTALAQREPGERVTLTIFRSGRRQTVTVQLAEFPRPEVGRRPVADGTRPELLLGFSVIPLTSQIAARLGLREQTGVVVAEIVPYSPAASAGMRPGQLILSINAQEVSSPADVARMAESLRPGLVVSVRVRDPQVGETIFNFRARR